LNDLQSRFSRYNYHVTPNAVLDHDHKTNALRGMLCSECNFGLGKFKDDEALMKKAIWYLESKGMRLK